MELSVLGQGNNTGYELLKFGNIVVNLFKRFKSLVVVYGREGAFDSVKVEVTFLRIDVDKQNAESLSFR